MKMDAILVALFFTSENKLAKLIMYKSQSNYSTQNRESLIVTKHIRGVSFSQWLMIIMSLNEPPLKLHFKNVELKHPNNTD